MATEPRAWIGSLAAYNAGRLVGAWIDLTGKDREEVEEEAREAMRPQIAGLMSEAQAFDEMQCMDHEGLGSLVSGECGIAEAVEAAEVLAELDENALTDAFEVYCKNLGPSNIDRATVVDDFPNALVGAYESERHFAESLIEESGALDALPEHLRYYFDYEAYARDLFLDGYTFLDGYVFSDR